MPRTAEAKLTSEERCEKAFEKHYGFKVPEPGGEAAPTLFTLWVGWASCWEYLEKQVTKEFIEK